jgi:CHAD domain-containing protein
LALVAAREFIATDSAADSALADVALAVQTALAKAAGRATKHGAESSVAAEPLTYLRRTWFDTFDWRLDKANLTLERIATGRSKVAGGRLVLASHGGTGGTLTSELVGPAPAGAPGSVRAAFPFDSVVPPGPMRSRLEPIVEMRALSPIVTLRTVVRTFRIRNDDGKTVARVVVEHAMGDQIGDPGDPGDPGGVGCWVLVVACRGYDAEAAATARVIAKLPGLAPTETSMFARAVSAIGRAPGDYSSKLDIALTVGMPTSYAMRRIMRALLDAAQRNVPGVLADTDSEFLHDLRVAIRRGRSALKVPGAALPAVQAEAAGVALKWLGDLTTPTRDLDVYLLGLDDLASEVSTPGWAVSQLGPFRDLLAARRAKEQAALVRSLRTVRARRSFDAWAAVSTGGEPDDPRDATAAASVGPAIESVAKAAVVRAFKRVIKAGSGIDPSSPPTDLHGLRKRCKELRYTLEIFAALHDPVAQRALVDDLKKLQDCLGEFQDTDVQQRAIRQFAAQMLADDASNPATVEAVMAMGRLADRLGERQVIARNTFATLFDRFAGPLPRAHLAALYERAA